MGSIPGSGTKISLAMEQLSLQATTIEALTPWLFLLFSPQSCLTLRDPKDCSPPDLCQWDFSDKNTGVGCYFLLQGIVLTQGSDLSLLHWQVDSSPLNHWESHS